MATTVHPRPGVYLSGLLKQPVLDQDGSSIGRLSDVIVALGAGYPHVKGLVVHTGNQDTFVHAAALTDLGPDRIGISGPALGADAFTRREGEVLLHADVLGHRFLDAHRARLVRAYDVALTDVDGTWQVTGLDVHRAGWLTRRHHQPHPPRDWAEFEALIGHHASARVRAPFGHLRRLKPAQIADLLEDASREEQREILGQVHEDPELEADVFEELDDEQQSRLLASRADSDIADVLGRMRADDAADALFDLPQERRKPVLDLLPTDQRRKVTTLLGYNETTAGGLMGVDWIAVASTASVDDALEAIRHARTDQPEALVTIYATDETGRLVAALGLIAALQADPGTPLGQIADTDPVRVHPATDVLDVVRCMSDYNLLTLPVVDDDQRILGVITVDDVLEAAIPENWRHREPATPGHQVADPQSEPRR